jgi:two-component system sensor histidine kinase ArlS
MKIRTKLTLLFTLITATILLIFAFVIYYSAKENRKNEFYAVLKNEAITKANLFFDVKITTKTLQHIYTKNRQLLNEVEVAIYDSTFRLVYHDAIDIDVVKETPSMMHAIYDKGELQFYQKNWQILGLRYPYEGKNYIITASAYDKYGYKKLANLFHTIVVVFIISIIFIYVAGRFFSKRVFAPVMEMTEKAKLISATNLDLRLSGNGSKDELSELANAFNEMLLRLENSFEAQKHFVSNISHELRTPLAAIIAELELASNIEGDIEKYKSAIRYTLNDSKRLVRLSNSLLDFAKASYDPLEISFKEIRLDEILLDARHQVMQANAAYSIDIHFEDAFESEEQITIQGNEYLLTVAFKNLFENGCKFSDNKRCVVTILIDAGKISLVFSNSGVEISEFDKEHLFVPFFRGESQKNVEGHGIGLPLTKKIIHLHKGTIEVESTHNKTNFIVELQTI